ncbi:MAG TPA: cobalamin biosynthesis protein CbiG [Desulfotomaculum sp.]|nr:MAG: hypothetical protein JL56_03660 [Desulfotomaculum sp. BICA1-6]HBX22784.1 cobalamin biosynthesis protein CbiG [Desulfotomaculum sp.]
MKTALFCLTASGYKLALKIKQSLAARGEQADLYAPSKEFAMHQTYTFSSLTTAVEEAFSRYRRIIMIMALGIVVRVIAPQIKDKNTDPAVVVLDEAGEHVISVLSGHLGGANELARLIGTLTGARPVITTATDVHGLPAVDELARVHNLALDPPSAARVINTALVNGSTVCFYVPNSIVQSNPKSGIEYRSPADYPNRCADAWYHVVVTNRIPDREVPNTVFLRPRNLVAGVGCRSGISEDHILAALNTALGLCRCSLLSLRALATIDVKENEPGLRQAAKRLNLPLLVFSPAQLNHVLQHSGHHMAHSAFVQQKVGTPAVCEPAALLASRKGELLLPKHKFQGITIAVAEDQ